MHARRAASRFLVLVVVLACATGLAASLAPAKPADPAGRIARQLAESGDESTSITDISPPPTVTASGWIVYDAAATEPIAAHAPATPRPIASLAKLMTALVVVERVQLDELVTIPEDINELSADAARMDARVGEKWPARDLLRAMLAHSANDAAIALSEHVADGDTAAFVELMNDRAEELGMSDTEFASATGFDTPGASNTSTPIDLVALVNAVLADDAIRSAVAAKSVTLTRPGGGTPIKLPNRNPLLGTYPGVDGVKTGFTDAAGYMLVVHHVDEETDGELLVVTFASSSEDARIKDARALLDWARTLRVDLRLVEAGTPYASIPVQRSDERISVFACEDLRVTARIGQDVVQEVVVPRSVRAPITTGDEIGELRARVGTGADEGDRPAPHTVPLCSGDDVSKRGRLDRLGDYAKDYRAAWRSGVDEVEDAWSSLTGNAA